MGNSLGIAGGLGGSLLGQADGNALKVRSMLHAACSALHKCVLLHAPLNQKIEAACAYAVMLCVLAAGAEAATLWLVGGRIC
jgi:hypothetical protein